MHLELTDHNKFDLMVEHNACIQLAKSSLFFLSISFSFRFVLILSSFHCFIFISSMECVSSISGKIIDIYVVN